jgi:GDP-L-fucose synthase
MREESLLSGPLEQTNEPYAVAKIAGVKLCENYFRQYGCNFFSVMPTNLYGPNDNFDLTTSHVIPALIRKFHEAKTTRSESVSVWGSGTPKREFMFVDDLSEAIEFLLENVNAADLHSTGTYHLNVGTGHDLTIQELAELVAQTVGYIGSIEFDATKPDGTPRKLLDVSKLRELGWTYSTNLIDGLRLTYKSFLANAADNACDALYG